MFEAAAAVWVAPTESVTLGPVISGTQPVQFRIATGFAPTIFETAADQLTPMRGVAVAGSRHFPFSYSPRTAETGATDSAWPKLATCAFPWTTPELPQPQSWPAPMARA